MSRKGINRATHQTLDMHSEGYGFELIFKHTDTPKIGEVLYEALQNIGMDCEITYFESEQSKDIDLTDLKSAIKALNRTYKSIKKGNHSHADTLPDWEVEEWIVKATELCRQSTDWLSQLQSVEEENDHK